MKSVWSNVPAAAALGFVSVSASAQISDLTNWTLLEDPPNALMNASVTPGAATLTAGNGVIASGTDIGYASVDGPDVANSTAGFYFDPDSDFRVAIDFDLSFASNTPPIGGLAVGFGIGEDVAGADSAGITALTQSGPLPIGALGVASRDGDALADASVLSFTPISTGSLLIAYTASTGDITGGYSAIPGDGMAQVSGTLTAAQNLWDDQGLLVSFFLRSDATLGSAWSTGDATAVFSNFRVLEGEAITIPEPTSALLLVTAGAGLLLRRRA